MAMSCIPYSASSSEGGGALISLGKRRHDQPAFCYALAQAVATYIKNEPAFRPDQENVDKATACLSTRISNGKKLRLSQYEWVARLIAQDPLCSIKVLSKDTLQVLGVGYEFIKVSLNSSTANQVFGEEQTRREEETNDYFLLSTRSEKFLNGYISQLQEEELTEKQALLGNIVRNASKSGHCCVIS